MQKSSKRDKIITSLVVVVPPAVLVWVMMNLWNGWVNLFSLGFLLLFFLISGFGVTIGFHRYFTHGSFETSRPIRYILAVAGMMATEGPLFKWVSDHRKHHVCSDEEGDPHSPHHHQGGFWGPIRGAVHAHVGWFFTKSTSNAKYARDLVEDKVLVWLNSHFLLWVLLGLLLPAVLALAITGSWWAAWLGLLWGGFIRIFAVHHMTWSINSVCHLWGSRRFDTHDESRNNFIFGILGLGEGWHHNHHAFPTSARHGLFWWEPDLTWFVICLLKRLRLVKNVRVPTPAQISLKLKT